mgnify:CR=1 FL=1
MGALSLLYWLNYSLDNVSLLGITLAVGLVVGLLAVVSILPAAVAIMLCFVVLAITIVVAQSRRSRMPPAPHDYLKPLDEGKSASAESGTEDSGTETDSKNKTASSK